MSPSSPSATGTRLRSAPFWLTVPLFTAVGSLGLVFGNDTAVALGAVPQIAGSASAVLGALQFGLAALVSPTGEPGRRGDGHAAGDRHGGGLCDRGRSPHGHAPLKSEALGILRDPTRTAKWRQSELRDATPER